MLRIVTRAQTAAERQAAIRSIDDASAAAEVELVTPLSELRTAVGDHVVILMRALLAMAVVMAIVGALGLGSTLGTSVVERTRELGVMKALGATPARISRLIVAEAAFITALSFVFALTASVPLTFAVDWLVGNLGFLAPLPLVIGVSPAFVWLVLSAVVGLSASWLPARRAAALSVREALSCN
jgi:putative ABC transport system permease protein